MRPLPEAGQLLGGLGARIVPWRSRVDDMLSDMANDDLGNEAIKGAAESGYLLLADQGETRSGKRDVRRYRKWILVAENTHNRNARISARKKLPGFIGAQATSAPQG